MERCVKVEKCVASKGRTGAFFGWQGKGLRERIS
jgi:hypothetical protein